jgi:hypothetical protein
VVTLSYGRALPPRTEPTALGSQTMRIDVHKALKKLETLRAQAAALDGTPREKKARPQRRKPRNRWKAKVDRAREKRRRLVRATKDALRDFDARTVDRTQRLRVLRAFAAVELENVPATWLKTERVVADLSRPHWFARYRGARCFVCGVRDVEHAHHVIQLQHGGADIDRNKVPVCGVCHADIHPWMPTDVQAVSPPLWW